MEAPIVPLTPRPGPADDVPGFPAAPVAGSLAAQPPSRGSVLLKDTANGALPHRPA
jgi:hypothetical protein